MSLDEIRARLGDVPEGGWQHNYTTSPFEESGSLDVDQMLKDIVTLLSLLDEARDVLEECEALIPAKSGWAEGHAFTLHTIRALLSRLERGE